MRVNDPLTDQKRAATLLQREEETTYVEEAIGDRLGDEASDLRGDRHWAASRSGVVESLENTVCSSGAGQGG